MKSGLAAAMIAMEELKKIENQLKGKVLFTAVVDEEGPYGLGTDALIRDGITDKCDMAIVTEPAAAFAPKGIHNPCLLIGARGRYLYDIRVKGKYCSRINALFRCKCSDRCIKDCFGVKEDEIGISSLLRGRVYLCPKDGRRRRDNFSS